MKPNALIFSTLALAGGMLIASPALAADPHAGHGAHAAKQASVSKTLVLGKQKATLVIEDARAHFKQQHAAHPDHPGIPTHRLVLKPNGGTLPDSAELTVILPTKQKQSTSLWKEDKALLGQVELKEKGTYRFTLIVPQGKGKATASFTHQI